MARPQRAILFFRLVASEPIALLPRRIVGSLRIATLSAAPSNGGNQARLPDQDKLPYCCLSNQVPSEERAMSEPLPLVRKSRISSQAIRETLAALGVIASLAFVGVQISISNTQARAAAYQAIGIATSEFHRSFDARLNRLSTESMYPQAIARWTLADWETYARMTRADLRMLETVQLQVEQGLLPDDAMSRLGYDWGKSLGSGYVGFVCLWPSLREQLGTAVRILIENSTPPAERGVCPIDLQELTDRTILGPSVE
jgi:hypothetical protein